MKVDYIDLLLHYFIIFPVFGKLLKPLNLKLKQLLLSEKER